ncbi:TM2 domain-containing protein (plasmid) [Alicyclobacillus sp. TC]|uniref:TM2 domain-containing membrane protein YozV n=1 Tax=Alicyclobacillus tolerans TaxID=90970 RepID=A0ABT9LYP3_9BACL|nr:MULTISPECIES: TM2 domain-containing protein [Alicyclobacillus]MDP9729384.1 TM2 domain-containing membrane protein YozV [Alicyclobacillus tengchongensis]QRF24877.1 TM2 domain-containing protein [Alicyclobacillus sp. TC]
MGNTQTTTTTTVVVGKNMVLAYVLWFFLGSLGIHRFYLGRIGTGIVQLILGVIGWATAVFVVGWFFLGVLYLWLLVDLFLIPGMARRSLGSDVLYHTVTTTTASEEKSE